MDLNLKIKIDDYDESCLKDDIISQAATQMLNEVMRNQDHYGRSFKEALTEEVRRIMVGTFDTDFKNEVKELVSLDLSKRFAKTAQYKELKAELGVESDTAIKTGLKEMISDIVRAEIRAFLQANDKLKEFLFGSKGE